MNSHLSSTLSAGFEGFSTAVRMRSSVLGLFPSGVWGAELTDPAQNLPMWANEIEAVSRATDRRVAEFAAGRHCARRALDLLGYPPVGIPRLPTNAPGWPAS